MYIWIKEYTRWVYLPDAPGTTCSLAESFAKW